jgi:NADPH-dependent ferric siderophore reductase
MIAAGGAAPRAVRVLRVRPDPAAPPVLRSYALSDLPSAERYRVSVKHEVNGVASGYIFDHVRPGDTLDVSAPRGSFTLRPGGDAMVLASAGVGATPVLAMLHALAAARSPRHIWWLSARAIARTTPSPPSRRSPELFRTPMHTSATAGPPRPTARASISTRPGT